VIGAQVISVPTSVPINRARAAFRGFMLSVTGVFIVIGLVLNFMLWRIVIRPVAKLSALADRVSTGDLEAPQFVARSHDEIAELAGSFARMRKSVEQAIKMLGD
jgi:HAMP domain-containing protein